MNKVIIKGRLTKDVEYSTSNSGVTISTFGVAVSRDFKNEDGEYEADFINCIAFRKTADFIKTYFRKGKEILLEGSLRVEKYQDKDGNNRTSVKVVVDKVEFCGNKQDVETKEESDPYLEYGEEVEIDNNFLD